MILRLDTNAINFLTPLRTFFSIVSPTIEAPKPEKKVLPEQSVVYYEPEKPVILLRPESKTLTTLANFRSRDKPLPELFPFPFAPESRQENRKRNPGKVPKPSKFVKGEMYHSDYESGSESFSGKIRCPVKWRSCSSDNEDSSYSYRQVLLLLLLLLFLLLLLLLLKRQ